MLVIRLARTGKRKQAYFRVVVAEKQRAVGAKFIEILGNYNPHAKKLEINKEALQKYLDNGATPSNTLAKLLKAEGVKLPKWVVITKRNRPAKKKEEKSEVAAPKAAEPTPEKSEPSSSEESKEVQPESEKPAEQATKDAPIEDKGDKEEKTKDVAAAEETKKEEKKEDEEEGKKE